jgi:hypothetical protein
MLCITAHPSFLYETEGQNLPGDYQKHGTFFTLTPINNFIQLLLQYKADVDITAPEDCSLKGRTPLMHNLKIGNYERSKV